MKWVRQRCQVAPNVEAIASMSPGCASETTSWTPESPRATSPRRNASHPAPSSVVMTSMPRTSRCPSALTAVATTTATDWMRPASRTFTNIASSQT